MDKKDKYWQLFLSTFKLSACTFGGGFVIIPLMRERFVKELHWIEEEEMLDLTAIAQSSPGSIAINASILVGYHVAGIPGPIAVNAATFVGIQVAGLPGALIATIGCIFPSCVIVMALAYMYYRFRGLSVMQGILAGLHPAVIAMIASAGISLVCMALYGQRTFPADLGNMDLIAVAIFLVGFVILRKWKPSPIKVMAGAAVAGVALYSIAA